MRYYSKCLITLWTLLLSVTATHAAGEVNVTTSPQNGGTLTATVADGVCTLKATPAAGYYLTVDYIKAVKSVAGSNAQSPRRAPDIDSTPLTITPVNPDADPGGETSYTFEMPEGEYNVEVSAEFQQQTAITPTVTLEGWTYGDTPNTPVVSGNTGKGEVTFTYAVKGTTAFVETVPANAGDYTVKASIAAAGTFAAGEATADFTIGKATPTLTMSDGDLRLDAYQSDATYSNMVNVTLNGQPLEGTFSFTYESSNERVATVSETGGVMPVGVGEATITVRGPIDDQNLNAATVTYKVTVYTTYGLTINTVAVDSDNRNDILGDGTVKFDGRQTLVLDNAHLTGDYAEFIKTSAAELTIYLIGENSIEGTGVSIRNLSNNGTLTLTTNGNTPGKLTLKNTSAGEQQPVVSGFTAILYEQNLAVLSGDMAQSEAAVGTPIKPIVDETGEQQTVDVTEGTQGTDLSNVTINEVLYTLEEENGDGVDEDYIVLGSTMADENVEETVDSYTPGTEEFANNFSGLTFMVPAGTGVIHIKAKTGENGVLNVKVGSNAPYVAEDALDFTDFEFPFACTEATYVYVYNASAVTSGGNAAPQRAGKKTTTTIGIRSIGVSSSQMQESNPTPGTDDNTVVELTDEEIEQQVMTTDDGAVIDNKDVTSLPENIFSGYGFMKNIDLRNTGITGMTVKRSEGAFNHVSANTFIFVPTGNYTDEPNVVIGVICSEAVLDANMSVGESFGPVGDFTAHHIALNRDFAQDETSTVYLPFDIDAKTAATMGTFYSFEKSTESFVKITEVTTGLKAHTPYLFKANADNTQLAANGAAVKMSALSAAPVRKAPAADGFHGCYEHFEATGTANVFRYVPSADLNNLKFVRMAAGEKVLPFQAYLVLNNATNDELTVTDKEEVLTGIQTVTPAAVADGAWHTLDGLQLKARPTVKGVYIHQGRKVIVK